MNKNVTSKYLSQRLDRLDFFPGGLDGPLYSSFSAHLGEIILRQTGAREELHSVRTCQAAVMIVIRLLEPRAIRNFVIHEHCKCARGKVLNNH